MGIQRVRPDFVATSVISGEDRSDRVVLEANPDHNTARRARLQRVVFVNNLTDLYKQDGDARYPVMGRQVRAGFRLRTQ